MDEGQPKTALLGDNEQDFVHLDKTTITLQLGNSDSDVTRADRHRVYRRRGSIHKDYHVSSI
jgi:hypothetical protein